MKTFAQPQMTFAVGDAVFAGGANGNRKDRPQTPLTKCGTPLVKNAAAMKWAI